MAHGLQPADLPQQQPPISPGIRAVILLVVLVVLVLGVSRFDLHGWTVPVGLLGSAALLRAWEKRVSS